MAQFCLFENPETRAFTLARQEFLRDFLEGAKRETELRSAVDVGCGLGNFSKFLVDIGFKVIGVDGREENTKEASSRHPDIPFLTFDAENLPTNDLGTFDLVLCFGLLYHLENPFRAVRNLHALTAKVLLIEGICVPGSAPTMTLMDEGQGENQGLNYVGFYPSASCLAKMLYRAGFPYVYGFSQLPDFHLYRASTWRKRERTVLAASKLPLKIPSLVVQEDSSYSATGANGPWTTAFSKATNPLRRADDIVLFMIKRLPRFLKRPWSEKREIVSWYLKHRSNRT